MVPSNIIFSKNVPPPPFRKKKKRIMTFQKKNRDYPNTKLQFYLHIPPFPNPH